MPWKASSAGEKPAAAGTDVYKRQGQGQEDDGYQVLEAAIAKLESFGLFAMCVPNHALLLSLIHI